MLTSHNSHMKLYLEVFFFFYNFTYVGNRYLRTLLLKKTLKYTVLKTSSLQKSILRKISLENDDGSTLA